MEGATVAFVSESSTAGRRFARAGGQGTVQAVRLLDADRELARRVGGDLAEARAAAVAGCVSIPRGRWSPDAAAERIRGGYGLLVLRGLLMRDLESPEALGAELVTEGDLLGPDDGTEERIVGLEPRWEILEPARLLVLDAAFAQRIARYPALASGLVERVHERARRTAIALALSHLPRVEDRLHRLLWHLADRRGHVRADGIVLRLPVTQEQLGRLVGARRPTVSLALRSLRERGLVRRGDADEWVLANQPPSPSPSAEVLVEARAGRRRTRCAGRRPAQQQPARPSAWRAQRWKSKSSTWSAISRREAQVARTSLTTGGRSG